MKEKITAIQSLLSSHKRIYGRFVPPPDKSITHRAIFLSALCPGRSRIQNPLLTGDCLSTLGAFERLGISIKKKPNEVVIEKGRKSKFSEFRELKGPGLPLDCGNSGTTMRLLTGALSGQPLSARLVGDASLSKRPMKRVIDPLRQMGAKIEARENNFAPLRIEGNPRLKPIYWKTPVASAQVKSAILLGGLFAEGKTTVEEPGKSRDHTERMLKGLGLKIVEKSDADGKSHIVSVWGGGKPESIDLAVPGDFSSAAFFIAAALIVSDSQLTIEKVNLNPTRTGLLAVLKRMGASIQIRSQKEIHKEQVGQIVASHSRLKGTQIHAQEIPGLIDEIPVLAVLATQAEGTTEISGAEELRVKESDRLAAIAAELRKMGARIEEKSDGLIIEGPAKLVGTRVHSYHDHRMAMSLAVAGLVAEGKTEIENFDCTYISFPNFLDSLQNVIR